MNIAMFLNAKCFFFNGWYMALDEISLGFERYRRLYLASDMLLDEFLCNDPIALSEATRSLGAMSGIDAELFRQTADVLLNKYKRPEDKHAIETGLILAFADMCSILGKGIRFDQGSFDKAYGASRSVNVHDAVNFLKYCFKGHNPDRDLLYARINPLFDPEDLKLLRKDINDELGMHGSSSDHIAFINVHKNAVRATLNSFVITASLEEFVERYEAHARSFLDFSGTSQSKAFDIKSRIVMAYGFEEKTPTMPSESDFGLICEMMRKANALASEKPIEFKRLFMEIYKSSFFAKSIEEHGVARPAFVANNPDYPIGISSDSTVRKAIAMTLASLIVSAGKPDMRDDYAPNDVKDAYASSKYCPKITFRYHSEAERPVAASFTPGIRDALKKSPDSRIPVREIVKEMREDENVQREKEREALEVIKEDARKLQAVSDNPYIASILQEGRAKSIDKVIELARIEVPNHIIHGELGEGAMKKAYAAMHKLSGRRVALLKIDPSSEGYTYLLERFPGLDKRDILNKIIEMEFSTVKIRDKVANTM
jgi:hypothetical protein